MVSFDKLSTLVAVSVSPMFMSNSTLLSSIKIMSPIFNVKNVLNCEITSQ